MAEYLTVAQVADRLQVSPGSVYAMVHKGELEAYRIRGGIRVPERALAAYLEARRVLPPARPGGAGPSPRARGRARKDYDFICLRPPRGFGGRP